LLRDKQETGFLAAVKRSREADRLRQSPYFSDQKKPGFSVPLPNNQARQYLSDDRD
jgi:hypothetical protein